jgi:BirA family biotin operon repressor/biotin-[acetyl-CoA-carboxylase] ligase
MIFNNSYPENLTVIQRTTLNSTSTTIRENLPQWQEKLPLMIVAAEQTEGRGREKKQWYSARGLGLYTSLAFRVQRNEILPFLALTAGLAVIDTLCQWGLACSSLQLKWPNDILFNHKKIAGILIENIIQAKEITSICGIGINLNHGCHDFPQDLTDRATSLRLAMNQQVTPLQIAPSLAGYFFQWLQSLQENNTALIVSKCNHYSRFMLNKKITLKHRHRSINGVFAGINEDGGLLLEGEDGFIRCHFSGEILAIPANPD